MPAEGQHPDQPDEAPPQGQVRLAPTAVHADPRAVHGLQLGLYRDDEHFNVGQGVPAVATVRTRNETGRRWQKSSGVRGSRAGHWPNMVKLGRRYALRLAADPKTPLISRAASCLERVKI